MFSYITRISFLLIFCISSTMTIFGQCDEYYINELISGGDEQCYFPQGSPVRFCPRLKGIAINGTSFDVMQWDGISTQYLTLTKNGGIAGTLVLKLNEVIDNSQQWSNTATLMLSSASAPFETSINDIVYLGLKINTDQGDYFGWIYIDQNGYDVTVISYALNQSVNNSINAGQIE